MNASVTLSELRQNIYRIADEVLETGQPIQIVRKGKTLRLVPDEISDHLAQIKTVPDLIVGDPDSLVTLDWASEWNPDGDHL